GNFGSVDGDGAAAMRYTEARLTKISMEMLSDINKDTVDFMPNFDETEREPVVLPSRFPNLLVNGTTGIAVGMATNIPPHNLREVIDAVVKIIDNIILEDRDTTIDEVMDIIKGPDFPTGGTILGRAGIEEAYRTGRGRIRVSAVTNIEPLKGGKNRIVVTELPYMVNKAKLIEKIAELYKEKKIDGIADLMDLSDRSGMRIHIDLKKDANPNIVMNQLNKHTQLTDTFGVNMLALVDGEPKILNLLEVLEYYLKHQEEVVTRRSKYELNKAEERAHILEGLLIALDNIDEVIQIVRSSRTTQEAKERLCERFGLTDPQAQAIVDMRIRALTGLEREKLEAEYADLLDRIAELKAILGDRKKLLAVIKEEILIISAKFGDDRRTQIGRDVDELADEDLIEESDVIITKTNLGYIKRMADSTFRTQGRCVKGVKGMQTIEDDFITDLLMTTTHHYIIFFTNQGRAYRLKTYEIPEGSRTARGTALVNLIQLNAGEKVTTVIPVKDFSDDHYLTMATKKGLIKRTPLSEYSNIRRNGLQAISLREGDELIEVKITDNTKDILMVSRDGQCIRFHESEARITGRVSYGVIGMKLKGDDEVVGMQLDDQGDFLLIISELGKGKKTRIEEFSTQKRGGQGVKCYKENDKTGPLVGAKAVTKKEEILVITTEGTVIRMKISGISTLGRITSGVRVIKLNEKKGEKVASFSKVREPEEEEPQPDDGQSKLNV
ncbi:MAG: DNA gyrase subunit A, partial [Lachnospiraceae bacterium]|nr:DNA gyrase subunit A [Lachnospiraceae bacterium]